MSEQLHAMVALTSWQCVKKVWASKITKIEDGKLFLDNSGYFLMPDGWAGKHKPEVGGYYVSYKGGYSSYSPAEPFEEGYRKLESVRDEIQFELEHTNVRLERLEHRVKLMAKSWYIATEAEIINANQLLEAASKYREALLVQLKLLDMPKAAH